MLNRTIGPKIEYRPQKSRKIWCWIWSKNIKIVLLRWRVHQRRRMALFITRTQWAFRIIMVGKLKGYNQILECHKVWIASKVKTPIWWIKLVAHTTMKISLHIIQIILKTVIPYKIHKLWSTIRSLVDLISKNWAPLQKPKPWTKTASYMTLT